MLQHLSVSHFYTLCTHNLTKFLLCWRVLFWPSFIGCFPPAPPSFLCTLFFSFNFYLLWFPLHVLFLLLQLVLLLPSFISIFLCFFFVTYSFFLLFFLISFLSPFFFPVSPTAWLSSMIIQKMLSCLVLCVSCSQFLCLAETLSLLVFKQNNILWATVISWTMYCHGVVIFLHAFSLVD